MHAATTSMSIMIGWLLPSLSSGHLTKGKAYTAEFTFLSFETGLLFSSDSYYAQNKWAY